MNRLTKKCMMASLGLHTLLILVLIVGPAFLSKKPDPMDQIITVIYPDAKPTDGETGGGGNPTVTEPPRAAAQQEPAPAPPAAPPQQKPEPPQREPEPPKAEPQKETRAPEPPPQKAEPVKSKEPDEIPVVKTTKTEPKFDFKPVNKNTTKTTTKTTTPSKTPDTKSESKFVFNKVTGRKVTTPTTATATPNNSQETSDNRQALSRELARNVGRFSDSIRGSAASSTSVEMPGPGGEAFVNFGQLVKERYDSAWRDPSDVSDENANVRVQVVIDRDGSVASARIVSRSGISAMDKSVQAALDRVRTIGLPFPAGSKDRQRTFILNFNLKTRRLTG